MEPIHYNTPRLFEIADRMRGPGAVAISPEPSTGNAAQQTKAGAGTDTVVQNAERLLLADSLKNVQSDQAHS